MNNQSTEAIFAENVLLLGAGFTKNFGGLLASEMWAEIFNHEKIQAQPQIREMMLENFDFESVYYTILSREELDEEYVKNYYVSPPTSTKEEKDAIKIATKFAYDQIDEILRNIILLNLHPPELENIREFIHHFPDKTKKSFIFTLNQDLFFERLYRYNHLSIPGIKNGIHIIDKYSYLRLPTGIDLKNKDILSEGNYFLIKLHGSCNWTSFDGSDVMVIGRGKREKIQNEPLLNDYYDLFKEVLSQRQRRLIVIGYGFGDEHINSVLSEAVKEHGLKIYILSPDSPEIFKRKLFEGAERDEDIRNIWKGISGYSQCINEILKGNIDGNLVRKKHFYRTFLGKEYVS